MNAQTQRSEECQRRGRRYDLWQECARQLRLMGFSLRQFLTVPYFIQLLISTVLGSVILQALAVHAAAQNLSLIHISLLRRERKPEELLIHDLERTFRLDSN